MGEWHWIHRTNRSAGVLSIFRRWIRLGCLSGHSDLLPQPFALASLIVAAPAARG